LISYEKIQRKNIYLNEKWEISELKLFDIVRPKSMLSKIRDAKDPVSYFIRNQLSQDTKRLLDKFDGQEPLKSLVIDILNELNRLIQDQSLMDKLEVNKLVIQETYRKEIRGGIKIKSKRKKRGIGGSSIKKRKKTRGKGKRPSFVSGGLPSLGKKR